MATATARPRCPRSAATRSSRFPAIRSCAAASFWRKLCSVGATCRTPTETANSTCPANRAAHSAESGRMRAASWTRWTPVFHAITRAPKWMSAAQCVAWSSFASTRRRPVLCVSSTSRQSPGRMSDNSCTSSRQPMPSGSASTPASRARARHDCVSDATRSRHARLHCESRHIDDVGSCALMEKTQSIDGSACSARPAAPLPATSYGASLIRPRGRRRRHS